MRLGEELGKAWAMSWSGLQPFLPLVLGALGISRLTLGPFWQRGLLLRGSGIRNRRRSWLLFTLLILARPVNKSPFLVAPRGLIYL